MRVILGTVFAKFVVGGQKVVDMEVRPPYSWVQRLKDEGKETHVAESASARLAKLIQLDKGSSINQSIDYKVASVLLTTLTLITIAFAGGGTHFGWYRFRMESISITREAYQ